MRLPSDFHMISSQTTWPKIENDTSCWQCKLGWHLAPAAASAPGRKLSHYSNRIEDSEALSSRRSAPNVTEFGIWQEVDLSHGFNKSQFMQNYAARRSNCCCLPGSQLTARNCNVDLVYGRATCKGRWGRPTGSPIWAKVNFSGVVYRISVKSMAKAELLAFAAQNNVALRLFFVHWTFCCYWLQGKVIEFCYVCLHSVYVIFVHVKQTWVQLAKQQLFK